MSPWCGTDELYIKYHDEEWEVPVHNDKKPDDSYIHPALKILFFNYSLSFLNLDIILNIIFPKS